MNDLEQATFGAGCFWCVEAIFQRLEGVVKVVSGFSGGMTEDPSYHEVCSGETGHAEVCQITFDPSRVSFEELLQVFWKTHDPTTRNRQGNDVGSQYRSVIFYHNEEQRKLVLDYKARLDNERIWAEPVLTEILPFEKFWPAEDYHRNYFNTNPDQGYCRMVIAPKIQKLQSLFGNRLKSSS